ncbi:MAG: hypothetical protein K2N05_10880 [Muribaculaceae bacterium]|nr:hypothetical protein [Muribaculaceae bacterium]
MSFKSIHKLSIYAVFFLFLCLYCGCNTGVESTKTIKYSKSDRKQLAPSPEDLFISAIRPVLLKDWEKGRNFMISDRRAALVFEGMASAYKEEELEGKEVAFAGIEERNTPGGIRNAFILFSDGGRNYAYPTGKTLDDALSSISSIDIPMMVDLSIVAQYRKLLLGKQLWTRTPLWYDKNGEKMKGRQFVPVKVWEVVPSNSGFQMRLTIIDENGEQAYMFMNVPNRGLESRTLPSLFYLNDPRLKHPSISDENWSLICNGLVQTGMTKEECKLSLGNPDDVNSGHDWNRTIDIWNYKNGSFLQFSDGLLTKFRI